MKRTLADIRSNLDFVGCDNETVLELCAEIERLTRELESANAIIQDERSLSHIRWLDAQTMRRERDEARKAARTILDSTEIADDNKIAVSRWPWLEET